MITDKTILSAFQDKSILVADDERFSRGIVGRLLHPLPVVEAEDGAFGMHLCLSRPDIALVICDFNMPVMDGLHFLKSIRTGMDGMRNDIPVLMLTGTSDYALVRIAMALDVDGFVVKPVSQAMLENRIKHILNHARDIGPPKSYEKVDIDEVARHLLQTMSTPQQTAAPQAVPDEPPPVNGTKMDLDAVKPASLLAQDIRTPGGELLLASGTPLSERMIRRLKDLVPLGVSPKEIWIQA